MTKKSIKQNIFGKNHCIIAKCVLDLQKIIDNSISTKNIHVQCTCAFTNSLKRAYCIIFVAGMHV